LTLGTGVLFTEPKLCITICYRIGKNLRAELYIFVRLFCVMSKEDITANKTFLHAFYTVRALKCVSSLLIAILRLLQSRQSGYIRSIYFSVISFQFDKFLDHWSKRRIPKLCSVFKERFFAWKSIHPESEKKQDTKLLPITSPNVNRFSIFFHCQT